MNELISFLQDQDVEFQTGKILSKCTAIGIGGPARLFLSPNSKEKFIRTLNYLSVNKIKFRVTGNMSNILPSDDEIKTVIVSTLKLNNFSFSGNSVYAECGMLFSKLILLAFKRSLGGCEALFGIPGTVGAMISVNAGAYGSEISDFLSTVEIYDATENSVTVLKKDDIAFFYRDSELKRQNFTVLSAIFEFLPAQKQETDKKLKEIKKRRADTQPLSSKTLGSVFKRTDTFPASYMIDRSGLKGRRIGRISVSEKHAGFFINEGGGTAKDFLRLSELVKNKVKEKYNLILEEEFEYLT